MKRNDEIVRLAGEILTEASDPNLPLYSSLLKAVRLSLLLDMTENVKWFKESAKYAEANQFVIGSYETNMQAARDRDVSASMGNLFERSRLNVEAKQVSGQLAALRTETYQFASAVHTKWAFGGVAETIFEKKRQRTEPKLREIFPDVNDRLNSIEQNISSDNPEDWKNAVTSCRTLMADLADVLNPSSPGGDKSKYINRLKDFVSPREDSKTRAEHLENYLEELKKRIHLVADSTQGSAHQVRPKKEDAENIVLMTYLLIADLLELHTTTDESQKTSGV